MLGSPILDVAIGMAFIYLLLSLIASAFQEVLASVVQARAANLERGLRSLFSGDGLVQGTALVDALYEHGLVRGLYQDPSKDYGPGVAEPKWTAFWRKIFGEMRLALRWLLHVSPPGKDAHIDDLLLPSYIPSRIFALAMRDLMNDPKPFGWDSIKNIENNLSALRQQYPDNKAVEALLALVIDAAAQPDKLQTNLENWYNDSMDRVAGWYRRYVQNILLFIGLAIAIALNVDSVRVARTLWVDKDARAGLAAAADQYIKKHPDPPRSIDPKTPPPDVTNSVDRKVMVSQLKETIGAYNDVSTTTLLPVGWRKTPSEYLRSFRCDEDHFLRLLETIVGWIITAIALSLGAPFWFDALNKFMVVRGTVKPQEKSQTDQSKDN